MTGHDESEGFCSEESELSSNKNYLDKWLSEQLNRTTTEVVDPSIDMPISELFNLDSPSKYVRTPTATTSEINSLDECIDNARQKDLFSIADLIRGHQPRKRQKTVDKKPIVYIRFNTKSSGRPRPVTLRALLDSGASGCLVARKHAKKLKMKQLANSQTVWTTPGGNLKTTEKCKGEFTIPELHDNRLIKWDLHISSNLGAYDMILGRDFMTDLGIDILFSSQEITWDDSTCPLKDADATLEESYHIREPNSTDSATSRLKKILDAKYEKADLRAVADACTHLEPEQREALFNLLTKHNQLFDGTLGKWKEEDYSIELKPDAKPYHARAFPIPKVHEGTLKMEVERLCKLGVLKRVNRSEWAAPTFIIPKKDGSVRFISDFRELNKRIRRKPYPIPKIQDLLLKLEGFQFATSLDLNMGYYHIELNPTSKRYCTIVLPFGKFEYQRLPMGLCNSPDIFQEKMAELFQGLEFVQAYIDDLLICTNDSFQDHLDKLDLVLRKLGEAGLKVNANKSFFGRHELEYLGYWISREGVQPLPKKVEAILNIAPPKNKKELRGFIGIVNYYRDMWIRRSHILAPLAALTSKTVKWKWTEVEDTAFENMKKVIAKETLLAYPDFNKPFVIHTDASHTQLGAVISQDDKPIAFYSRKLKPEQTRYTTTERELLSIVETLKEFRNILLGQQIVVHTDHKNLTCKNFNTERVMRWRLILEEYSPELRYIKGEHNIVADALSRLSLKESDDDSARIAEGISKEVEAEVATTILKSTQAAMTYADLFLDDEDIRDCPKHYPLHYRRLQVEQQREEGLLAKADSDPAYAVEEYGHSDHSYSLLVRKDSQGNSKIIVPKALQKEAVEWYHELLAHPGETRTELTIGQHFHWEGMRKTVEAVCKKCGSCQINKKKNKKYGHLPVKNAEVIPWHTLCIDLIGPYKVGHGRQQRELHCLTMIDPATGWFEIAPIDNKQADVVANELEFAWLTRYPWPTEVVLDRGKEFMAEVKTMLRDHYGCVRKAITTRNPQANAMVERAHQTLHNMIRTQRIHELPGGQQDDAWRGMLAAVSFGMRSTVHTTTRATPMQLTFGRDAIHNIRFKADWEYIKRRKQKLIVQNNQRENSKRVDYTYRVGEKVLVTSGFNRKYGEDLYKGPYEVTRVYDNGTVRLSQGTKNGGVVDQTWNIRNLTPYKD